MRYLGDDYGTPPFAGVGNVTVAGTLNNSWTSGNLSVTFGGAWASVPVALTLDQSFGTGSGAYSYDFATTNNHNSTATKTVVAAGAAGTNEVQSLTQTGSAPSESFRITFGGQTSELIPYGSTAQEVEYRLARMTSIGMMGSSDLNPSAYTMAPVPNPLTSTTLGRTNVVCAGGPLGSAAVTCTFRGGGLQSSNVATLGLVESRNLVQVDEITVGTPGVAEQQTIAITGNPWGGTFPLTYSGQTTSGIVYNPTAAVIRLAMEALSNLAPGEIAVTGEGPWQVTFSAALGNVPLLTSTGASLKNGSIVVATLTEGGLTITQQTIKRSRGPWHFDDPYNWTLNRVPDRTDQLQYQFGKTGPRWGITQRASFTIDPTDGTRVLCAADFTDGQAIEARSSGTLPTGLSAATAYYVRDFDGASQTMRLASTLGGAPISLSGGSGTHELFLPLAGLKTLASWSGWIGNLVTDDKGKFRDYRATYFRCGWQSGAQITLGEGPGSASGLVRIDSGTWPITLEALAASGSAEPGLPAMLWLGEHADNAIQNIDGDLGIALLVNETVTLHHLVQRAGSAELGAGVTFTSGGYIDKTGGTLLAQATLDGPLLIRG